MTCRRRSCPSRDLLGIDEASIPREAPYLAVRKNLIDDDVTVLSREAAGVSGALPVGLSWAGNPGHANDRRRSIPLALLTPLLELPGVAWFSLQKGDGESEIASIPAAARIVRLDARNDFARKGALLQKLDLVISVDTGDAHLAGALARPLWLFYRFARLALGPRPQRFALVSDCAPLPAAGARETRASVVAEVRALLLARLSRR